LKAEQPTYTSQLLLGAPSKAETNTYASQLLLGGPLKAENLYIAVVAESPFDQAE